MIRLYPGYEDCATCNGEGYVPPWMGDGIERDGAAMCPECEGQGIVKAEEPSTNLQKE